MLSSYIGSSCVACILSLSVSHWSLCRVRGVLWSGRSQLHIKAFLECLSVGADNICHCSLHSPWRVSQGSRVEDHGPLLLLALLFSTLPFSPIHADTHTRWLLWHHAPPFLETSNQASVWPRTESLAAAAKSFICVPHRSLTHPSSALCRCIIFFFISRRIYSFLFVGLLVTNPLSGFVHSSSPTIEVKSSSCVVCACFFCF